MMSEVDWFDITIRIIYLLTPFIILVLEWGHRKERKDLYDRIMSGALPAYTAHQEQQKKKAIVEKPKELIQL